MIKMKKLKAINIRVADCNDAANLAAISISSWVDTYSSNGLDPILSTFALENFTIDYFLECINHKYAYVAETDNGVCGYLLLSSSSNTKHEVEKLYILRGYKSLGIGSMLIEYAFKLFFGEFTVKCATDNASAISFYKKNDFEFYENGEFIVQNKSYPLLILKKTVIRVQVAIKNKG